MGSAWLNTARNRANLHTYHEAGITHYRILSVMDERTSPVCASLNGTVFSVAQQLQQEERACASETLDELRAVRPWLNTKGKTVGFYRSDKSFVPVTRAPGAKGPALHSASELQRLGVGMPPYHALCRTTVVSV